MEEQIKLMTLGDKIKTFRNFRNLTQQELGEKIGLSLGTISLWESDKSVPKLEHIYKMSEALDIPTNLFTEETVDNQQDIVRILYSLPTKRKVQPNVVAESSFKYVGKPTLSEMRDELVKSLNASKEKDYSQELSRIIANVNQRAYITEIPDEEDDLYELDDDEVALLEVYRELSDSDKNEILNYANYKYTKVIQERNKELRRANNLLSRKDLTIGQINEVMQKVKNILDGMDVSQDDEDDFDSDFIN